MIRSSPIALAATLALPVTAAAQDTAARVDTTRAHVLRGEWLRSLPIDDAREAFALVPGVLGRGLTWGVLAHGDAAVRGGAAGGSSVYIDGAPARLQLFGGDGVLPPLAGIELVRLTTGNAPLWVADAGGGLIEYVTRSGGDRLAADFRAESDALAGDAGRVGYDRFEGWAGGPVPGAARLRWFVSGAALGQASQYRGPGAPPVYVTGGIDTLLQSSSGAQVVVPRYVQWSGDCGGTGNGANTVGTAIRGNYGYECQGARRPFDWSSDMRLHGKVTYDYGAAGQVSFTGIASGRQQRFFPGTLIGVPQLYEGQHDWSRLLVADWRHALRVMGHDAALRVNLSRGTDRSLRGPLDPASEATSRLPPLALAFQALRFSATDMIPFPLDEAMIRNIRRNSGVSVPYRDRQDLRLSQPYRLNPYGLKRGGWATSGFATRVLLASEERVQGRASLEWQAAAHHRVAVGADAERTVVSYYNAATINLTDLDAFRVEPRRLGLFVSDRIALDGLMVDAGLRYDRLHSGGMFPDTPGRIYTNPAWDPASVTDDSAYARSVAAVFADSHWQGLLSPRVSVTVLPDEATVIRASYGQTVERPSWTDQHRRANADLDFTSTFVPYGRDVDYAHTALAEIGVRRAFGAALTADAAGYWRNRARPYRYRIRPFDDPFNPGDTIQVPVLETAPGASVTGVDLALHWRRGTLRLTGVYSWLHLSEEARAGGARPTTHALAGVASAAVPDGWRRGTMFGTAAAGMSAVATFRFTSGRAYTRLKNDGLGWTTTSQPVLVANAIEPLNASRLPWTRRFDLRLEKRWRAALVDWALYVDVRNLLGFANLVDLFVETGSAVNSVHRSTVLATEASELVLEAESNGALAADGQTIDLRGNCGAWLEPVNCASLQRVENRFGDGDGLYTAAEQLRALNAYYDAFLGSWRFYEPGRTVRIGIELAL
jgi:hypothetical protein